MICEECKNNCNGVCKSFNKDIEFDTLICEKFEHKYPVVKIQLDNGCEDLMPTMSHNDDMGYDIKARENVLLKAHTSMLVGTGVHMQLPKEEGYIWNCEVRSRSGLAAKNGIFVLNSPGTIDQSYTGECKVILCNNSDNDYRIQRGDRIAQLVPQRRPIVVFEIVNSLDETDRGNGGFGSSGK